MTPFARRPPRRRWAGTATPSILLPLWLASVLVPEPCSAEHRLGSLIDVVPGVGVGPNFGTADYVFADTNSLTKYFIMRFGSQIDGGDRVEIKVGGGVVQTFDASSNPAFWTLPIEADGSTLVTISYVDDDMDGVGGVTLQRYGRGEEIDLFLKSNFVDPPLLSSFGVCPSQPLLPSWQNVDCMADGSLMKTVSESAGIIVFATEGDDPGDEKLSSCSATLIEPNLILTAGHCIAGDDSIERESASFTLDFQTECGGSPPASYAPRFFKVTATVRSGFARQPWDNRPDLDYTILRVDPPGAGAVPIEFADSPAALGDDIFLIHHPRGATKKVSSQNTEAGTCEVRGFVSSSVVAEGDRLQHGCDLDNGSSGSASFDAATGKIVALNNWAGNCFSQSLIYTEILNDFLTDPPDPEDVDTMMVLDVSGSMNLPGESGDDKLFEAQQAAALFIDLLSTSASHRFGLASFSSDANLEYGLQDFTEGAKDDLIGLTPSVAVGGIVGDLDAAGSTSIGDGLLVAQTELSSPPPSSNRPVILLMTDGLQNTPAFIQDVDIEDSRICAIGFGTEASLDGPLLTNLANENDGIYTRAGDGLELKKFFVLCFGSVFNTGIATDPTYVIPRDKRESEQIDIKLCRETSLTVVIGWNSTSAPLRIELESPGGIVITRSSPGVESSVGSTWAWLRLNLPYLGEQTGTWKAKAVVQIILERRRLQTPYVNRFIFAAIVDGGPILRPIRNRTIVYTGDAIDPRVRIRNPNGSIVPATVSVHVQRPGKGAGNALFGAPTFDPGSQDFDPIDARTNGLLERESNTAGPLIPTVAETKSLGGGCDGVLEPDGAFCLGRRDALVARFEGTYTFRAVAQFRGAGGCSGTRETTWSVHAAVGVDAGTTEVVSVDVPGTLCGDGSLKVVITIAPRDAFGNYLGPGQLDSFDFVPIPGITIHGVATDNGDGTYSIEVCWDQSIADVPGVGIGQPERPEVVIEVDPEDILPTCEFVCDNPCTPKAIHYGKFYHPSCIDNERYFIQCDESGNCYDKSCCEGTVWSQEHKACVHEVSGGCQLCGNPCTPQNIANEDLFHPFCDNAHMFIQCDKFGGCFVMPCAPGTKWNDILKKCA